MYADFHRLPIRSAQLDAAVAALYIYLSAAPAAAAAEITRCLTPNRITLFTTSPPTATASKTHQRSAPAWTPMRLPGGASTRDFHSANALAIGAELMRVGQVEHEQHQGDQAHRPRAARTSCQPDEGAYISEPSSR
jgi:hypothetical protein